MNKKSLYIVIACLILIGLYVGYSRSYKMETTSSREQSVIRIGGLSALTGTGAGIGQEERNGMVLAVDEINKNGGIQGHQLKLINEDFGFDNINLGPAIVSKLVDIDKVSAIVGPQWDEPADAILPSIEKSQIPTISADVTTNVEATTNYPYFFSTWYDNRSGIQKILSYAQSKNLKKSLLFVLSMEVSGNSLQIFSLNQRLIMGLRLLTM